MHNIQLWSFPEKTAPKKIVREIYDSVLDNVMSEYPDEDCTESGWDSMASTAADIRFEPDRVFDTVEAAKKYLWEHQGSYDNRAVYAYVPKSANKAQEKVEALLTKRTELLKQLSVHNRTSNFIGCEYCGSKISRAHLKGEKCPVCGTDLRPASSLSRIKALDEKIRAAKSAASKPTKKGKKIWVVLTDYHT